MLSRIAAWIRLPNRSSISLNLSPIFAPSKKLFPSGTATISESCKFSDIFTLDAQADLVHPFYEDGRSTLKATHAHPDAEYGVVDDHPRETPVQVQLGYPRHIILSFNLQRS